MTRTHHIPPRLKPLFTGFVALLLFGLVACKKDTPNNPHDPNTLPPLTHEGKNTFGCLVNGEVWVAYAPFTVGGAVAITGDFDLGEGYIRATKKNNEHYQVIGLYFRQITGVGEYSIYLNSATKLGIMYLDGKAPHACSSIFYHDTSNVGIINITYLNTSSRIISGMFKMDLVNPTCPGDTIRIREGRFDWRY